MGCKCRKKCDCKSEQSEVKTTAVARRRACCEDLHVVRTSTNYQIQACDKVIIVVAAPGQAIPVHLVLPTNPCLGQELTISTEVDVIVDGLI